MHRVNAALGAFHNEHLRQEVFSVTTGPQWEWKRQSVSKLRIFGLKRDDAVVENTKINKEKFQIMYSSHYIQIS
jgi:hypothetical protein